MKNARPVVGKARCRGTDDHSAAARESLQQLLERDLAAWEEAKAAIAKAKATSRSPASYRLPCGPGGEAPRRAS